MIRSFFVDCMIVFAMCLVVWGVAPVFAGCVICEETVEGITCPKDPVKTKDDVYACENQGEVCGEMKRWLIWSVECNCRFRAKTHSACWCGTPG